MASLGELTAGIAHEIQNPLNFIQNFSELCIELTHELEAERASGENNPADADTLQSLTESLIDISAKIRDHSHRASRIVRSMLEHSRSGSQERKLTNVNALVSDALDLSRNGFRAGEKAVDVDVLLQLDEAIPEIEVVPADISRVFLNLFNNSFYFLLEKSTRAGDSFAPRLTASSVVKDETVIVMIRDNGPGIPGSVLEKVFQPFFTTKATGEGTGLGLSISYRIVVDGHGGEMTVSSQPGEWTEFTVILPLITGESAAE
jgi:signal transduction histidine kinase